eukprot:870783-Pyramimonas_sp.AAC.1
MQSWAGSGQLARDARSECGARPTCIPSLNNSLWHAMSACVTGVGQGSKEQETEFDMFCNIGVPRLAYEIFWKAERMRDQDVRGECVLYKQVAHAQKSRSLMRGA